MTDTPTKQVIQSENDNVPGATPVEQKKNNRNDRKRNRRGDSKNLERDSDSVSYTHLTLPTIFRV